jgi:sulfate/thiosulfate transport system substrate-binding protein
MQRNWILALALTFVAGCGTDPNQVELLNVSYDPTRELWKDVNKAFAADFETRTGKKIRLQQSHGGSSSQARSVVDGLPADVVTLALWSDTDALRKKNLLAEGWEERLPHRSLPYYSTIVFVVRKGNPKNIHDWPDLIKPGVGVVTPNPKTSGNGRLSYLAAWGSVRASGGSEQDAQDYVKSLYENVLVLDTGARGATVTFGQRQIGDVHLTWENEAYLEVREAKGELEVIYPSASIKAEPHVAWVDAVVERKGTQDAAKAYLEFLYTDAAQEIIGQHYYRPINPEALQKFSTRFPDIKLFPITSFTNGWEDANAKFFAEGALFDQIYRKKS